MYGKVINMQTYKFIFQNNFDVKIQPNITLVKHHASALFYVEYEASGRLVLLSNVNAPNSILLTGAKNCDVDLAINNTTLNVSNYAISYAPYLMLGISVVTSSSVPINAVHNGNILVKYKSPNVTVGV